MLNTQTTNSLPTAEIITPAAPTSVPIGTPITFEGRGTDPDNDPITAYDWRDGSCGAGGTQLGTAALLSNIDTSTWSIGDHVINLRVTDSVGGPSVCDTVTITILPPPIPDLTIVSFTVPASFTKDTAADLSGVVRNSGGVTTGTGFSDNFTYRWSTTDPWQEFALKPHPALAPNGTVSDDTTFTPDRTGTLYLQYCADATGALNEGAAGEANNCLQRGPFNVTDSTSAKTATINATPCIIPSGSATCNTLITWTSANLRSPSIKQYSTEFATAASNNTGVTRSVTRSAGSPSDTFSVSDGATTIDQETVTPVCTGGDANWNGTTCDTGGPVTPGTPTLKASPRIVEEGKNTTLTWTTGGVTEDQCILKGGAFGSNGIAAVDGGSDQGGTIDTPVTANTTYTITCPAGGSSASVRVEVIPRYFPS